MVRHLGQQYLKMRGNGDGFVAGTQRNAACGADFLKGNKQDERQNL
jgi:hypothetical protein